MTALRWVTRACALSVLCGLVGCGDSGSGDVRADGPSAERAGSPGASPQQPEQPSTQAKGTATVATAPTTPAQPPSSAASRERPPAKPGAAYFSVRGKGIVVLTEDGFASLPGAETVTARQLVFGPSGTLYSLGETGVGRVEGAAWVLKFPAAKTKAKAKTGAQADGWRRLAVSSDGTPWVLGLRTVGRGAADGWSTEVASHIGATADLLDIAVDVEGRPWVASTDGLRYRDDRGWHAADDRAFSTLAVDPGGDGVLAFGKTPLRIRGPASMVELPWTGSDPAPGTVVSWGMHGGASWTGADEEPLRWRDDFGEGHYTGQDVLPGQVVALALDAAARVWVATDAGVCVLSSSASVAWPLGSVRELAGPVDAMLVASGGPSLPPAGPLQTGTLEGTILLDGKPLAGAPLELCPQPGTRVKSTPCEASPLRRTLTTDAKGRFSAADVPLGAYGVGVKVDGAWKITFGGAYGGEMKPGERHDIGSLDFQAGTSP